MRNTLVIHQDRSTFPIAVDCHGRVDLGTRKDYHFVYSEDICQMVSGIPFLRIDTNVKLTAKEIQFLTSRVRGSDYIDPSGADICIWREKYNNGVTVSIGLGQIDVTNENAPRGEELERIINKMLKETFK